jgi:hypothetical protein
MSRQDERPGFGDDDLRLGGVGRRAEQRETLVAPRFDDRPIAHERHGTPRAQVRRDLVTQRQNVKFFRRAGDAHTRAEDAAIGHLRVGEQRKADLQRLTLTVHVEGKHGRDEVAHDLALLVGLHDQEVQVIANGALGNDSHVDVWIQSRNARIAVLAGRCD